MLRRIILMLLLLPSLVQASTGAEWILKKRVNLEAPPLATVPSGDGGSVYFLVPGKVIVYSIAEGRVTDFMPVERKFDRLSVPPKGKLFILSSSTENSVSLFEWRKGIDLSGLPYRGAADAPVVVAVYSDYQ